MITNECSAVLQSRPPKTETLRGRDQDYDRARPSQDRNQTDANQTLHDT